MWGHKTLPLLPNGRELWRVLLASELTRWSRDLMWWHQSSDSPPVIPCFLPSLKNCWGWEHYHISFLYSILCLREPDLQHFVPGWVQDSRCYNVMLDLDCSALPGWQWGPHHWQYLARKVSGRLMYNWSSFISGELGLYAWNEIH